MSFAVYTSLPQSQISADFQSKVASYKTLRSCSRFLFPDIPSDAAKKQVRQCLLRGGDWAWKPDQLEIKAIFFDMDATLIAQESLVEIAGLLGHRETVQRITEDAMNGKIGFPEALNQRLAIFKGQDETIWQRALPLLSLNSGLKVFSEECIAANIKLYLISGGFLPIAEHFAKPLGFTAWHANILQTDKGLFTGALKTTVVDGKEKARWVMEIKQREGLDSDACVAIGDGANDALMMREVGYAIGYHAKPVLYPLLHANVGCGDYGFLSDVFFG